MRFISLCVLLLCWFGGLANASDLRAVIDKSEQTMTVYLDEVVVNQWLVSTSARDTWTRTGTFGVQFLDSKHRSRKYNNAPMPWSVFYDGDRAIHGTTKIEKLGTVDSHGCVRSAPENARLFFNLVLQVGRKNTVIIVQD